MHLFAIIESVKDEKAESGELIVRPFLKLQLNDQLVSQYVKLFEDYVDFYRKESFETSEDLALQVESKNILQVTKICNQLNKELFQDERIILFMQLIELINTDHKVTQKENDFILLVALNFNIPRSEINDIKSFILDDGGYNISKNNAMEIDNKVTEWPEEIAWMMKKKRKPGVTEFRHMYVENFFGIMLVLYIRSISTFTFRYDGPLNLFLEGKEVLKGKSYLIKPGAIIKGPNIQPIYELDITKKFLLDDEKKIKTVFEATDIQFKFKNSNNGIHPFSFVEESGHLIGIMGGSGTGKSTLLNLLNGTLEPNSGKIHINGYKINRCVEQGAIGYVPQDDLLFEELTVYQNLYFNAQLSFSDFEEDRIRSTVNKILIDLDIYETRDLTVGSPLNKTISGGQRKRLNIALELMREPAVLFVDEPTSGLSSTDSMMVMNLLKEQARKGKLVIVIIHQPSSDIFKLFDKLWILDKGGYPIYNGNPIDAVVYFKTMITQVNAAESECQTCGNVVTEQILEIIEAKEINDQGRPTGERKVSPSAWYNRYLENIVPKLKRVKWQTALPPSNFSIPNLLDQFVIFSKRNINAKLTNTQYILLNILEPPILVLILGYLSKYSPGDEYVFADNKNLPVYLFMSVVVALFLGMSISAEEIYKDKKILVRESFLNLSRLSYLNSKIAYLFALSAFQTIIFILLGNLILEIQGMTLSFWMVLFSTACFANMVGLNISAGLNSIVTIYILIPLILVPQLLLGGAMIKFDELHHSITGKIYVPVVGDLMVSRWAYEALAVEQFKYNAYEKDYYEFDRMISHASYQSSFLIPRLERKLEQSLGALTAGDSSRAKGHLGLIRNEFFKLQERDDNHTFNRFNDLEPDYFTQNTYDNALYYLNSLRKKYQSLREDANDQREDVYRNRIKLLGKEEALKIREHHNTNLANLVLNRDELTKVYETDFAYVQKKDPIFMYPDSDYGQAHFYAPLKIVGSWHIDTLWFNLFMIWSITAVLYLALIKDVLRRSLVFLGKLFKGKEYSG